MSAGVDQWSMLGLGQDQKTEEKDKQGLGKSEDKGKLSPRRVVQPGAASSTGFIRVPPSLGWYYTTHGWCYDWERYR